MGARFKASLPPQLLTRYPIPAHPPKGQERDEELGGSRGEGGGDSGDRREETTRVTRDPEQRGKRGRRRCRADTRAALVSRCAGELAGMPPQ